MSFNDNDIDVGLPWLHLAELGVNSIFLSNAFISSADNSLPDLIEP